MFYYDKYFENIMPLHKASAPHRNPPRLNYLISIPARWSQTGKRAVCFARNLNSVYLGLFILGQRFWQSIQASRFRHVDFCPLILACIFWPWWFPDVQSPDGWPPGQPEGLTDALPFLETWTYLSYSPIFVFIVLVNIEFKLMSKLFL